MFKAKNFMALIMMLAALSECKFESSTKVFPFSGPIGFWDVSITNMVAHSSTLPNAMQFYNFQTQQMLNITFPAITADTMSFITNSLNNNASFCFIVMNSNLTSSSFKSMSLRFPLPNDAVLFSGTNYTTWGFGSTASQFYATSNSQNLSWLRGGNLYTNTYPNPNVLFLQQASNGNEIFYAALNLPTNTSSDLIIYQTRLAGQPIFYNNYTYTSCPSMKIDAYADILLINCGGFVEVRQATSPYAVINQLVANYPIQEAIYLNGSNSLMIKTSIGSLQQYDIDSLTLVDSVSITISAPTFMHRIGDNRVYIFNSISGTTFDTSPFDPSLNGRIVYSYDKLEVHRISQIIGNTMAITSIRFICQSNVPLALFFEEFWLYRYYMSFEYPQIMKIFMQEFEIINLIKQNVSFINFDTSNISLGSSLRYSPNYTSTSISYSPLYFGETVKDYTLINVPVTFALFIFCKILFTGVKKLRKKAPGFVNFALGFLNQKVQCWSLLLGLIESNFLSLCYYCLNQINLCFSLASDNKIALIVSVLLLFILFVYSTILYPLLGQLVGRKFQVILVFSKHKRMLSFWLQNWLIITLKFAKCFAHSLIIRDVITKFSFLIVCDVMIILAFINFRKLFLNQLHFAVYTLYQVVILTVNIMLVLLTSSHFKFSDRLEWAFLYCFLILIGLTLIKFLLSVAKTIIQYCRKYNTNRIEPTKQKVIGDQVINMRARKQSNTGAKPVITLNLCPSVASPVEKTMATVPVFTKYRIQKKIKIVKEQRQMKAQKTTLAVQTTTNHHQQPELKKNELNQITILP